MAVKDIVKTGGNIPYGSQSRRVKKPRPIQATNEQRRAMCDFARDHNFIIQPSGGMNYYLDVFAKTGTCPCDSNRKKCPCDEAMEEVPKIGHCLCHLLWRSYDDFKEVKLK